MPFSYFSPGVAIIICWRRHALFHLCRAMHYARRRCFRHYFADCYAMPPPMLAFSPRRYYFIISPPFYCLMISPRCRHCAIAMKRYAFIAATLMPLLPGAMPILFCHDAMPAIFDFAATPLMPLFRQLIAAACFAYAAAPITPR